MGRKHLMGWLGLFLATGVVLLLGLAWTYGVIGGAITASGARIIPPAPPPHLLASRPLRILVLGTSLTSRGNWLAGLETQLNACSSHEIRVRRLALAGANSHWGLAMLKADFTSRDTPAPDVLIVEFSSNDAAPYNGMPLLLSARNHRRIIRLAQAQGATVFLATMSPSFGRDSWERPGQPRYQALYRDLARETGSGLIDTIKDWQDMEPAQRKQQIPDGAHPTEAAQMAITVPAFTQALTPYLCKD